MFNPNEKSDRHALRLAAFFLLAGVASTVLYLADALTAVDQHVYAALAALQSDVLTFLLSALTHLGGKEALIPIGVGLLLLMLWRGLRLEAMFLLAALLGAEMANELLKIVFDRPRPAGINLIELPDSGSFPSGHAMISCSLYGMLAYLIKRKMRGAAKKWLIASFYLLIAAILLSRAYLGVHFASDILAGAFLGLAWYYVVRYWYERAARRRSMTDYMHV